MDEFDLDMDAMYGAALAYHDRGWAILPISASGKRPLISWAAMQREGVDIDVVNRWFDDGVTSTRGIVHKEFNLGIITGQKSGLVVIDTDNDEAGKDLDLLNIRSPVLVQSPRGTHLYFRWTRPTKTMTGFKGIVGCDVRGDGGYVVAPPSTRHDGTYRWLVSPGFSLDDQDAWTGFDWSSSRAMPEPVASATALPSLHDVTTFGDTDLQVLRQQKGRGMQAGEGRNRTLLGLLGRHVRQGARDMDALLTIAHEINSTEFDDPLSDQEVFTVATSVLSMDRRNHPELYLDHVVDDVIKRAERRKPVVTAKDLMDRPVAHQGMIVDPIMPVAHITQIYGYTGHGKSMVALGCAIAAATGSAFGPFRAQRRARVLYVDQEQSIIDLQDRMRLLTHIIGHDPDIHFWTVDDGLNLLNATEVSALVEQVIETKPEVIVFDTIRSCTFGMDERDVQAWGSLNRFFKRLRSMGISVVVLHHANKPQRGPTGQFLMGSEAGSTAQLSDIETQVRVTLCVRSKDEAERKRARYSNGIIAITDGLQDMAGEDWQLGPVYEIQYEKTRRPSIEHMTQYMALAHQGDMVKVVSTRSVRQRVDLLYSKGLRAREIVEALAGSTSSVDGDVIACGTPAVFLSETKIKSILANK